MKDKMRIFTKNKWKSGITKWLDNPRFEGCESGNFGAVLSVTNYEDIKDLLPKTLKSIGSYKTLNEALCG